jgi:hypothetical protein
MLTGTLGSATLVGQSFPNLIVTTVGAFLTPFLPTIVQLVNAFPNLQNAAASLTSLLGALPGLGSLPGQLVGLVGGAGGGQPPIQAISPASPAGFFWTG